MMSQTTLDLDRWENEGGRLHRLGSERAALEQEPKTQRVERWPASELTNEPRAESADVIHHRHDDDD